MGIYDSWLNHPRWGAAASRIFEGTLALTLGAVLGGVLGFLPPKVWVVLAASGVLLLFPLHPGKFLLGYLIVSPILDQLVRLFHSPVPVEPQTLFRGGLTLILVYHWLAIQRNPLATVKATRPMLLFLLLLAFNTLGCGRIDSFDISNLAKLAFWMLLLPTIADVVAHQMVSLNSIYRCMALSIFIMTASVLVASWLGMTQYSRYDVGETSGLFTPHALSISLSMGLIVTLGLATKQQNRPIRWSLLLFSAVIVLSIAKTYVRTGWTACFALLATLNFMFWRHGKGNSGRKTLIWAQLIIAGMIVIYGLTHLEALIARNSDFYDEEQIAGSGRIGYYLYFLGVYAHDSILEKFIGGGFADAVLTTPYRSYTPHNDYITILVVGGLIGISLYLWLFISLWKQIKPPDQRHSFPFIMATCALVTYLVAGLTANMYTEVSVMTYFSFLVGGSIGYYQLLFARDENDFRVKKGNYGLDENF